MMTINEIKTELVHIAADLISGQWSSPYREDLPPRTSKKVIRDLEMDQDHRLKLAKKLKAIYDSLSPSTEERKP